MEIWKDIDGFEGWYQVSDLGNVRSLKSNKVLSQKYDGRKSYKMVHLDKKTYNVHRLVAKAFIPNPNELPIVNHKDENKLNNNAKNLEWCDYKYNSNYGSIKHQFKKSKKVYQYDKDMNLINEFESVNKASRETKINEDGISLCCRKIYNTSGGYIWRYEKEIVGGNQ